MIIPEFNEKTFPVYEMERYINEEPSDEEKQFNKILESVKRFELIPRVSEMTAILEYEEKALNYAFKLSIETLDKRGFENDLTDISNAVNDEEFYKKALNNDILFVKYCTLQKVIGEILVIREIKEAVRELIFNMNNNERQILHAITSLKTEWKYNNFSLFFILKTAVGLLWIR